jgi:hypothetical protein
MVTVGNVSDGSVVDVLEKGDAYVCVIGKWVTVDVGQVFRVLYILEKVVSQRGVGAPGLEQGMRPARRTRAVAQ